MSFRHLGHYGWYDPIIFALAAVTVYPDEVLDWLPDKTGRSFDWRSLFLLELLAIGLIILGMYLLMPIYPKLVWWEPALIVGLLTAIRAGVWLVMRFFGFND